MGWKLLLRLFFKLTIPDGALPGHVNPTGRQKLAECLSMIGLVTLVLVRLQSLTVDSWPALPESQRLGV